MNKKILVLSLPFLTSCSKVSVNKTIRVANVCDFDYTIKQAEKVNEFVSIKTQTLSKDRIDKIIELDYTIRNTSKFKQEKTTDGAKEVGVYFFTLSSHSSKERRKIEIGETNKITDSSDYSYYYTFERTKESSEIFHSLKPTLDRLIKSAETEITIC